MKKETSPSNDLLRKQAELRAKGLLADVHEKWTHPDGHPSLSPLPKVFEAERRQRSDRMTSQEAARLGLTKPASKRDRMGKR